VNIVASDIDMIKSFINKIKDYFSSSDFVELKPNGSSYADPDKAFSTPEGKRRLKKVSETLDSFEDQ